MGAGGTAGNCSTPAAGFDNLFGFQFHPDGEAEKFSAAPKAQKPLFINSSCEEAWFGGWICAS